MKKLFIVCLLSTVIICQAYGKEGDPIDEFRKQVDMVSKRLLNVVESVPAGIKWPPVFEVVEKEEINAYAVIRDGQPVVKINSYISSVTDGIPDRLAYIVGHELIHLLKGHCNNMSNPSGVLYKAIFTQADEEEADMEGMALLLRAGYSFSEAANTFKVMREKFGDYSPLEAQSVDHPSWSQRLEYIDKAQERLWRSMSAYNNGVTFLLTQNYEAGIVCFQKVTKEFPKCYEAYSNIGYACLMQYCDLFEEDDIKYFNIGQVVVGGFYRRPASLERQIRGIDEELWWNAVGNLKEALRINPSLSLVKSYLGVAYFLDPRKQSLGNSEKYFSEALEMVKKDATLDPSLKACVYLNAGAIDIARSNYAGADQKLDSARSYQQQSKSRLHKYQSFRSNVSSAISYPFLLDYALDFNRIMIEFRKNPASLKTADIKILLRYLRNSDPASVWWDVAYSLYADCSRLVGATPAKKEEIFNETTVRKSPVSSISVDGFPVYLSQDIHEILVRFKKFNQIPVVEERKIFRYQFPDQKIELVAGKEVLMIIIKQNNPVVKLGVKNRFYKGINVGIQSDLIEKRFENLCREDFLFNDKTYKFYYETGLAFLVTGSSVISEVLITQKPTKPKMVW